MIVTSSLEVGAFVIGLLCVSLLVADGLFFECSPVAVGLLIVDCLLWTYWAPVFGLWRLSCDPYGRKVTSYATYSLKTNYE